MNEDAESGISSANIKAGKAGGGNLPERPVFEAMWRGFRQRCPACGHGCLYRRYLKSVERCQACGEAMHHHRADDAPPYFTVFGVGHLLIPIMLTVEQLYAPPLWLHLALFLPFTALLCLILLPRVKGAIIALQWAHYMHGFDPNEAEASAAEIKDHLPAPRP